MEGLPRVYGYVTMNLKWDNGKDNSYQARKVKRMLLASSFPVKICGHHHRAATLMLEAHHKRVVQVNMHTTKVRAILLEPPVIVTRKVKFKPDPSLEKVKYICFSIDVEKLLRHGGRFVFYLTNHDHLVTVEAWLPKNFPMRHIQIHEVIPWKPIEV